jgi:replication-associated recombination protein RarA
MAFIEELKNDFLKLIENQNLSHSYIFFGETPKEQFEFSKKLANYLENCEWTLNSHLLIDAMVVDGKEDSIGIDIIKEAINFLWLKPIKTEKKILVIDNAHKLTTEAQNAILKISEEPPEYSLIILILKNPEALVPALISRFQKIYFSERREKCESHANDTNNLVKEFLEAGFKERREIIKEIIENSQILTDFVKSLITELNRDPIKNQKVLKELLGRWKLINQYNVNKKLQLEAVLLEL